MGNLLKSKSSQEASTLTWVIATILVFVILVIFIVFTGLWFVKDGGLNAEFSYSEIPKELMTEKLTEFLNMQAGEYGTVYDLLVEYNLEDVPERRKRFKSMAEDFLKKNFPIEKYGSVLYFISLKDLPKFDDVNGNKKWYVLNDYLAESISGFSSYTKIRSRDGDGRDFFSSSIIIGSDKAIYIFIDKR